MKIATVRRIITSCSFKVLWNLFFNFSIKGAFAIEKFKTRLKKNKPFFPAFLMLSVTNRCNLKCVGCWVEQTIEPKDLSHKQIDHIIKTSKKYGSHFFGILGGEPLLYPQLISIFKRHKNCYFQLFTNGTLLTQKVAKELASLGNVTPLISIEGLENESRLRRGKEDTFARSIAGLENAISSKLFTGVAASICQSNFDELVSEKYLDFLTTKGVHYIWYYIYRPVGPHPNPNNALSEQQIIALRAFIVAQRLRAKILIIDAYWDADGNAICPAATGLSHHISPTGAVEFCPPMQFTGEYLNEEGSNLEAIFQSQPFLKELRLLTTTQSRGCILLENPHELLKCVTCQHAYDSSLRDAKAELSAMSSLPGHNFSPPIPERSWLYKLAKKCYFFGFGAYG